MSHLATAAVNVSSLREYARKELLEILDKTPGKKALVLDQKLSGPLSLIAEYSLLKEHGVEKVYLLQQGKLDTEHKNLIYICRPRMIYMKYIADHIHGHKKEQQRKEYNLYLVPRRTIICEKVLEEEGVYGEIQVGEYNLDLIPFDSDLLSLELDTSFREFYLEGDRTSLFYVARSLMKLQTIFGVIPKIQGKGVCSKLVADMMIRMRREIGNEEAPITPEIENLILIDRNVDMVTPMCSQLTYEGLIDEFLGIHSTCVELDAAMTGFKEKRKVPLNSGDSIYQGIRDSNFSVVGPLLNKSAKRINAEYEERHSAKTMAELRNFIGKLGNIQQEHQSLRIHTNVAEYIMNITKEADFHRKLDVEQSLIAGIDSPANTEYIEELINKQESLLKVLRLMCLYCQVYGGMKQKVLDNFKKEIIQTYGYDKIFTLNNLEKIGLIRKLDPKNNFNAIRKGFRLAVEGIDEKDPDDISYVYSGYAPLSVRIIQYFLQYPYQKQNPQQWKGIEELLRILPGPTFEAAQQLPPGLQTKKTYGAPQNKVTLVFFLGGCTFTEIAATRFLSKQPEGRDFIIATTKMINGNTLLESVFEQIEKIH